MKYDKRWLYTLPCVSCVLLREKSSRTGSRTSFLLLGRLSIGTVTCRQFSGRPCANQGAPDIRSTENPPYSQRQPHASQLSCHSFLIIHEVILNCKNYFCIYLQTILVNFTILQFMNCRVEHFYFTWFLRVFQQEWGMPEWGMIYPVFTPVSRAGKFRNKNKYFPALEKSFRTGYIIPHSGFRCPWKIVAAGHIMTRSGYSLPEGEFRSCQEGRPAANGQRACVLSLEEKRLGMEGCI